MTPFLNQVKDFICPKSFEVRYAFTNDICNERVAVIWNSFVGNEIRTLATKRVHLIPIIVMQIWIRADCEIFGLNGDELPCDE